MSDEQTPPVAGSPPAKRKKGSGHRIYSGEHGEALKQHQQRLARAIKLRWESHLTEPEIARSLGIAESTVNTMLRPFKPMLDDPARTKEFKKHEPEIMDAIRMLMVDGMHKILTDEKRIAKMDLSRLTYGFGIMYDKARLERGESTANVKTLLPQIPSLCPNCGYCPHCGQSRVMQPYYVPYYYSPQPIWPQYQVWSGTGVTTWSNNTLQSSSS